MTHGFFVCFQRNQNATEYYTDRFENIEIIVMRREITFFSQPVLWDRVLFAFGLSKESRREVDGWALFQSLIEVMKK